MRASLASRSRDPFDVARLSALPFIRAVEGLYDYDPAYVHAASFARKNDTAQIAFLPDTLFGGFARAIRIDSSSGAGLTFVAGQMKFANRGLTLAALDTTTHRISDDSTERRHDLAVAIRVLDQFLGPELHDTIQLAEVHLFVRDTIWQTEQDSCRCAFFTPFDTVRITKGAYDSIAIHSPWAMGAAFRDIIHTFAFPDDTLVGAGDTNIRYRPDGTSFDVLQFPLPDRLTFCPLVCSLFSSH